MQDLCTPPILAYPAGFRKFVRKGFVQSLFSVFDEPGTSPHGFRVGVSSSSPRPTVHAFGTTEVLQQFDGLASTDPYAGFGGAPSKTSS
jgi:hypothetical protein